MSTPSDPGRVLTIDDLRSWERVGPSLAVIGHPIAHSRSPLMHNAALREMAATDPRFAEWTYFKFDVPPERLAEALPLFHQKGFVGLNLTIPHKVDAVALVDSLSAQGRAAGAVNTLVARDAGWLGHNTDGAGFARACETRLGVKLAGADVVLLGAGGAARAVAAAALDARCRSLVVVNRDAARLEGLLETLRPLAAPGVLSGVSPAGVAIPAGALVVNGTSLGLKADDASPLSSGLLRPGMRVYDTVYGAHETALAREAREAGVPVETGLSMLCWQGALALELWTKAAVPVGAMWRAIGGQGNI